MMLARFNARRMHSNTETWASTDDAAFTRVYRRYAELQRHINEAPRWQLFTMDRDSEPVFLAPHAQVAVSWHIHCAAPKRTESFTNAVASSMLRRRTPEDPQPDSCLGT